MDKIFTIHDVLPMPDKMIDNFEDLSGSLPTLVHCEPIQPLEDRLDVDIFSRPLQDVLWVTFSDVSRQSLTKQTH